MKKLWIAAGISAAAVAAIVVWLLFRSGPEPAPEILPSASPSATPSGTPLPEDGEVVTDGEDRESYDAKQREVANNPLLDQIPKYTNYWSLTFDGVQGDKYALTAVIFYKSPENPQAKVEQQKPYILNFIRGTGQPDGTYTVTYRPEAAGGPGD